MINFVLTLIVIAVPLYMLVSIVIGYLNATGSTWQRLVAAFRSSASILWARINALSVAAVAALSEVSPLIGAPGIMEAIEPYLSPGYMAAYVVVVLIGAELARRRTLA